MVQAPPQRVDRTASRRWTRQLIAVALLPELALGIYMGYAAFKGSGDLLYPQTETQVKLPSAYGIPFDRVSFRGHDGVPLVGWYVKAAHPTTKAVLLLHGYGSRKDTVFARYARWLHEDFNLFVYDSRFSGESGGLWQTLGYFESRDAAVAIDQVKARGNTSIGLFGESMGGAVAVTAAGRSRDIRAVWEDCAFDTLEDAIAPRAALQGYPLSTWVASAVIGGACLRTGGDLPESDPVHWVAAIAPRPLMIVHGQRDIYTTPVNGERLFAAAREPKKMWRTAEAGHADSFAVYPDAYEARLRGFFNEAL